VREGNRGRLVGGSHTSMREISKLPTLIFSSRLVALEEMSSVPIVYSGLFDDELRV